MADEFPTEVKDNILKYMLGGNACFCIRQKTADGIKEMWYRIRKSESSDMYFVYTQDGKIGKYLGYFFKDDIGRVSTLRVKNKAAEADIGYATPLVRTLSKLKNSGCLWSSVKVVSDGVCSVCGRRIKDSESLAYGIGPTCRKKMGLM